MSATAMVQNRRVPNQCFSFHCLIWLFCPILRILTRNLMFVCFFPSELMDSGESQLSFLSLLFLRASLRPRQIISEKRSPRGPASPGGRGRGGLFQTWLACGAPGSTRPRPAHEMRMQLSEHTQTCCFLPESDPLK